MDHAAAQEWLDRYIAAWESYDPDAIAGLFSEDVVYRYHPYDEPIVGRDAVVASWLGEAESGDASTRTIPGPTTRSTPPSLSTAKWSSPPARRTYRDTPGRAGRQRSTTTAS